MLEDSEKDVQPHVGPTKYFVDHFRTSLTISSLTVSRHSIDLLTTHICFARRIWQIPFSHFFQIHTTDVRRFND